mgnify:FL=1
MGIQEIGMIVAGVVVLATLVWVANKIKSKST